MKITIHNLAFERNEQFLFKEINSILHAGDLLQVRGANGSGKSTLLRILAAYIEPQIGQVSYNDQCIFQQRDAYLQQLHYLGHQNGVKPYLSVLENIKLMCSLKRIPPNSIQSVIQKVGLQHIIHSQTQTLSAGQLRRLALARLLLHSVSLWILDEPTTALDHQGQQLFFDLLTQHLDQGGIAIITSHHELPFHTMKIIQLGECNA